jgi:hypothetical protein
VALSVGGQNDNGAGRAWAGSDCRKSCVGAHQGSRRGSGLRWHGTRGDPARAATPRRFHSLQFVLVPCILLAACSIGPGRVPPDRFDYNEALARSSKEQLLINLVRLRYGDVPVFLAVDSVLTQYVYAGDVSLTGSVGRASGDSLSSVTGAAGAAYIERPTVTYSPVTGEKFAEQLLDPIQDGLICRWSSRDGRRTKC